MRKISKTKKLQLVTIIIACSLIFYAIGIITDFFASAAFSMFNIISYETAHNVATYAALLSAIALIIVTAIYTDLFKKHKTAFSETDNNPVTFTIQASYEVPVKLTPVANNQKITKYLENSSEGKEKQSITDKNAITNQEIIGEGNIICSICKKAFRTPFYKIDSSSSQLEVIRMCPYCGQSLDLQPENALDDWWVRTFNAPLSTVR
jgi:uncharacterized membrane protein/DNA-directed RNA polymerase subunit RPC12/RpoP